jgi:hypothetical protein
MPFYTKAKALGLNVEIYYIIQYHCLIYDPNDKTIYLCYIVVFSMTYINIIIFIFYDRTMTK